MNVDGRRALELWEAIHGAGDAQPYGTEAMHVLRAEKGYPIVGQDTDGTVTPHDLGMDWIVSKTKRVPRQALVRRADTARPDRKQLVGLLPLDRETSSPRARSFPRRATRARCTGTSRRAIAAPRSGGRSRSRCCERPRADRRDRLRERRRGRGHGLGALRQGGHAPRWPS